MDNSATPTPLPISRPQDPPRALVLMATYNGERYVRSQIESILAQQGVLVTLHIRDDCSTDSTPTICQEYADTHDNVCFFENKTNMGVAKNFMELVYSPEAKGYDLYAFSDQDDVWFPNKLKTASLHLLNERSAAIPTLYFSDIMNEWVDEQGNCVKSEREISRFRDCENAPLTLLLTNWVNGCAMVFNARLWELLNQYRLQEYPRYHDSWVHMVARFCGRVIADYDTVLMERRITGANTVGQTQFVVKTPKQALHLLKLTFSEREHIMQCCAQLFVDGYERKIHPEFRQAIIAFAHYRSSIANRWRSVARNKYWLPSLQARIRMRVALLIGFY